MGVCNLAPGISCFWKHYVMCVTPCNRGLLLGKLSKESYKEMEAVESQEDESLGDGDAPDVNNCSGVKSSSLPLSRGKVKKKCKCLTCGKTFSNKSNLSRHTVVHSGQKNFQCPVCSNRFFRKSDVNVHMSVHAAEKDFRCDVCQKNFSSKSNLTRHRVVHTGQRSFSCELCGKGFFRRSDMNEHMIFHTGEKHFKCHVCGKEFFWRSHLNAHVVAHTGERNHACAVCGKRFSSKTNLNRHAVVHSGEKNLRCPECGKEFFWKSQFTEHMVVHTGERNFQCAICCKDFAHRSTLRKHMRSHLMNEIRCETQMSVTFDDDEDETVAAVAEVGYGSQIGCDAVSGNLNALPYPLLIVPNPVSHEGNGSNIESCSSVIGTCIYTGVKESSCSDDASDVSSGLKEEKSVAIKEEWKELLNGTE